MSDPIDDLVRAAQKAATVMDSHQTPRSGGELHEAAIQLRAAAEAAERQRTKQTGTASPGVRFMITLFCVLLGIAMPLFFAGQFGFDDGWFAKVLAVIGGGLGWLLARNVLDGDRG